MFSRHRTPLATVATVIAEAYPDRALLRRHPEPVEKGLEDVRRLCDAVGLELAGSSSLQLQALMERVDHAGDALLALLVRSRASVP